jgi:hypothetical protein
MIGELSEWKLKGRLYEELASLQIRMGNGSQ